MFTGRLLFDDRRRRTSTCLLLIHCNATICMLLIILILCLIGIVSWFTASWALLLFPIDSLKPPLLLLFLLDLLIASKIPLSERRRSLLIVVLFWGHLLRLIRACNGNSSDLSAINTGFYAWIKYVFVVFSFWHRIESCWVVSFDFSFNFPLLLRAIAIMLLILLTREPIMLFLILAIVILIEYIQLV